MTFFITELNAALIGIPVATFSAPPHPLDRLVGTIITILLVSTYISLKITVLGVFTGNNIYHEGSISSFTDFSVVFSLFNLRKRNKGSHRRRKRWKFKMQNQTCFNTFRFKCHLKIFKPTYRPFTLFFLSFHFVFWILRLINSMVELIDFMVQHLLLGVKLIMLFGHI